MRRKVDFEIFAESQQAINNYMNFKTGNCFIHEARVLVSSRGKIEYNEILKIIPGIETNISLVEIVGDAQFDQDYYGRYTNEYQKFIFINDTLLIEGEDKWGNPIEIDITSV